MINKQIALSKINREELYRYLGYKGNTPDDVIMDIIAEYEQRLFKTVKPAYIFKVFDIAEKIEDCDYKGIEFFGTDLLLEGNSIRKHLAGCDKAVLLAATLSVEVDKLIRQTELKDMTKALITDTLASVAIEQVCEMAESNIKEYFKDKYLTYRYGVGYGDLPLYHERMILDILNASKLIGLYCSDLNILTPRKSVVCVVGVSNSPMPKGQRGCITCNMSKVCDYKKRGLNCGY